MSTLSLILNDSSSTLGETSMRRHDTCHVICEAKRDLGPRGTPSRISGNAVALLDTAGIIEEEAT